MDWQQPAALAIVAATAGIFIWRRVRPRRFSLAKDTACGCSGGGGRGPSIIVQGRRGECPKITVK
jgi:hypothetical protein